MSPTSMSWPMTLAPTNEAISRENHAENALVIVGKTYLHDPGGHVRCKDSITIYKRKVW